MTPHSVKLLRLKYAEDEPRLELYLADISLTIFKALVLSDLYAEQVGHLLLGIAHTVPGFPNHFSLPCWVPVHIATSRQIRLS